MTTIAEFTAQIRENNIRKGFRPAEGGPGSNTWGDYIALLHSEISEALEAYRDHRLEDATELYECPPDGCFGVADCASGHSALTKPEGVGSELADTAIRLLDMADVFGIKAYDMDMELGDVASLADPVSLGLVSFGDWITWLHHRADRMRHDQLYATPLMLRALVTAARSFGIDLESEVVRKIAYNATRPFHHGGRTVADGAMQSPVTRNAGLMSDARRKELYEATPTDPRGWWTGDEVDEFISAWARLRLPELVMQDAAGDQLILWCTDVPRACEMLGVEMGSDEGFSLLNSNDYEVSIVQSEEKRETKDA